MQHGGLFVASETVRGVQQLWERSPTRPMGHIGPMGPIGLVSPVKTWQQFPIPSSDRRTGSSKRVEYAG
jgi:hypothetical protein